MSKNRILALGLAGLMTMASQAMASEPMTGESMTGEPRATETDPRSGRAQAAKPEFLGVDLDNGDVYYNGRNSGRYCLYRTVDVFNRQTGYVEPRRVRRCGHGLYLR